MTVCGEKKIEYIIKRKPTQKRANVISFSPKQKYTLLSFQKRSS